MVHLHQDASRRLLSAAVIQGKRILAAAREQAATIISKARESAERECEMARRAGYHEGRDEAAAEVWQLILGARRRLTDHAALLADVALTVANEVIAEEVAAKPAALVSRLARVADETVTRAGGTLLVNPAEVDAVRATLDARGAHLSTLSLKSGDDVPPGSARLTTPDGELVLSIEKHLQMMDRAVRAELTHRIRASEGHYRSGSEGLTPWASEES